MFGDNILQILSEKKISQVEMAKVLNISPAGLNGYVKNKREPDFSTLIKISNYLNCSIDYLLSNNDSLFPVFKINASIDPDYASMLTLWNQMSPDQKSVTLKYMELVSETTSKSNAPFSRKKSNYQQNKLDDDEIITLPVVARSGERTQITTTRKQFDEDIRNLKPSDDEDL